MVIKTDEDEIRKSGLHYYECPLCDHILETTFEITTEVTRMLWTSIRDSMILNTECTFYCKHCKKSFVGTKNDNPDITVYERTNKSVFFADKLAHPKKYLLKQCQFGKWVQPVEVKQVNIVLEKESE